MKNLLYIVVSLLLILFVVEKGLENNSHSETNTTDTNDGRNYSHSYNSYYSYNFNQHQADFDIQGVAVSNRLRSKVASHSEVWKYKLSQISDTYTKGFNSPNSTLSYGLGFEIPGVAIPSYINRRILHTHKNSIKTNDAYASDLRQIE